ncbi:RNase adapter RapZ [Candidatus Oleimmundimicrobium sp.]|uniref:RNase adapter RapZ n=1 Tax=Candidatus Oleimmundimicrobium sp. TaxID=3060597 RepID=UPI00271646B4|nr:RNase adapter RapZ [Candidatus Oleimmundimicrobium sp.]MDO8885712.1 RNase adapter RapZ [Candidatus Oleimmundimicrobium sp.]
MKDLEFTIITGLSGAGKSEAIRCFEDMGYFCIDNLPPSLIMKMVELCSLPGSKIDKVALVIDVRGGKFFDTLSAALKELKTKGINYQILFLEASNEEIIKRFKKTRRRHPLSLSGQIIDGIEREKNILEGLKGRADMVINTTNIEAHELKDKIRSSFLGKGKKKGILTTVISFGYKYGVPLDADLVFDVRFLPNPHYIDELRSHTGQEKAVKDFILNRKETKVFMKKFFSLLAFVMPYYIAEGKTHLVIALGCTGGTHRSVTLAEKTKNFLEEKNYNVTLRHRDIGRDFEAE